MAQPEKSRGQGDPVGSQLVSCPPANENPDGADLREMAVGNPLAIVARARM